MDLVLFGAGQLAAVTTVYLQNHSNVNIVGYTVDQSFIEENSFNNLPLVAWDRLERHFPPDEVQLFGPISFRQLNKFRRDRYLDGKKRGYDFYTFVHPLSNVYTSAIGENVLILEGNTLQPFTTIGDNCILWSNNHIGHHTSIGNHCFLAGHVGLGGNTKVGNGVFFAGKSAAIDNISIGDYSLLTFGAKLNRSIPQNTVVSAPKIRVLKNKAECYAKRYLG